MKILCLAAILAVFFVPAADAAAFKPRRGISLDIWTTWPQEDQWSDAKAVLPFPEWRKTMGAKELKALKGAGFDFVRMPIDPSIFLSDKSAALHDQLYDSVLQSVKMAEDAGLNVIVDLHWLPGSATRPIGTSEVLKDTATFENYLTFTRRIAQSIARENPERVALEPFNEPTIDCDSDGTNDWPAKLKQTFAAARASAPDLTLILSGACWGGAEGLAKLDPKDYPDDNLIWSFHSYDPFIITHQGATWTGDFMPYVYGLPFPLYDTPKPELDKILDTIRERIKSDAPADKVSGHLAYLDEQVALIATEGGQEAEMERNFSIVSDWATKNNIDPSTIILGEFGIIRQEYQNPVIIPGPVRAAYYKAQMERAERHGFAWALWSYGGPFGVVEEFESRKSETDVIDMVKELSR